MKSIIYECAFKTGFRAKNRKGEIMDTDYNTKELFERYSDMIYRIAISYGNQVSLAEDIVQEVFLRFLKKKPHFKNSRHEKAWFIRVTVNCCKSMVSSAWMKHTRPLEDAGQVAITFQHEDEEELYELMAKLPAIYRTVLYLRYYEEYQVKEIAKLLHITPNLVSARLSRAKKIMKKEIIKERKGLGNETGIIQRDV